MCSWYTRFVARRRPLASLRSFLFQKKPGNVSLCRGHLPEGPTTGRAPSATLDRPYPAPARTRKDARQQRRMGFYGAELSGLVAREHGFARTGGQTNVSGGHRPHHRRNTRARTGARHVLFPHALRKGATLRNQAGSKFVPGRRNRLDEGGPARARRETRIPNVDDGADPFPNRADARQSVAAGGKLSQRMLDVRP